MDTRAASLKIMGLALAGKNQENILTEDRVKVNLEYLKKIQEKIVKVEVDRKPDCQPDDKACLSRCRQRRERVVDFMMATLSREALNNTDVLERIDRLVQEYDEIYKQAAFASDFFEGSDIIEDELTS